MNDFEGFSPSAAKEQKIEQGDIAYKGIANEKIEAYLRSNGNHKSDNEEESKEDGDSGNDNDNGESLVFKEYKRLFPNGLSGPKENVRKEQEESSEQRVGKEKSEWLFPTGEMHRIEESPVCFSDVIPMDGRYLSLDNPYLQLIELKQDNTGGISGLFLFADHEGESSFIGYIVFSWGNDKTVKADLAINLLPNKKEIIKVFKDIPQSLQEAIPQTSWDKALAVAGR